MNTDQSEKKPFTGDGPVWDRIKLYLPWLGLLFWWVVYFGPMFRPISEKLQEIGGLPPLTAVLVHFDQLNEAWFYLPAIMLTVGFIGFNEAAFSYLRRRSNGRPWSTHWSTAMFLVLVLVVAAGMYALTLPKSGIRQIEASRKVTAAGSQQAVEVEQILV